MPDNTNSTSIPTTQTTPSIPSVPAVAPAKTAESFLASLSENYGQDFGQKNNKNLDIYDGQSSTATTPSSLQSSKPYGSSVIPAQSSASAQYPKNTKVTTATTPPKDSKTKKPFLSKLALPLNKEKFQDLPSSIHYWFIAGFVALAILLFILIASLIPRSNSSANFTSAQDNNSSQSSVQITNNSLIYDNNSGTDSEQANNPSFNLGDSFGAKSGTLNAKLLDSNGKLLGRINPTTGEVVDTTGKIIGKFNQSSSELLDSSGKVIAKINTLTGEITDITGKAVGSLQIDNEVADAPIAKANLVDKLKEFFNPISTLKTTNTNSNKSNSGDTSSDKSNQTPDKNIFGADGNLIGKIDAKTNNLLDATGKITGKFDPVTGNLLNNTGKVIAKIDAATGGILDGAGKLIGRIEDVKNSNTGFNLGLGGVNSNNGANNGANSNNGSSNFDTNLLNNGGANSSLIIPKDTICQGKCPLINSNLKINGPNDVVNFLLVIARLIGYFAVPLAVLVVVYIGIMTIFGVIKNPMALILNVAIGLALAILAITFVAFYTGILSSTGINFDIFG